MASSASRAAARFEARITADVQRQLKRAAQLEGRSLTDFVMSAALEAAQRTIERTEAILVSVEDHARLMEALRDPPEPTRALRDAFKAHRELIAE